MNEQQPKQTEQPSTPESLHLKEGLNAVYLPELQQVSR